ncbi:hypothetical protein HDU77_004170 [Chytriomyces hyalinus]|nr:hypothetical protein HDU77_004170 [Chytriomyces hyalinus]
MKIADLFSTALAASTINSGTTLDGFPTYSTIVSLLQKTAAANPLIATYSSIGQTREGRDIPSLSIHYHHPSTPTDGKGRPSGGYVDMRRSVLFVGGVQPREVLSMTALVALVDRMIAVGVSGEDGTVMQAIKGAKAVFVPMLNADGYEHVRGVFPLHKDSIVKNGAPGCSSANVTSSGVNLGHNWDFEWNYEVISSEDYNNPCDASYRGPGPFSEPETRALRDLILKENPKAVIIVHSRHTSEESRLIVPFMFHKSTFLSQSKSKLQMLSDQDISAYKNLTDSMQSSLAAADARYTIGTSWETIQHTISGSDLDWIFDNTGAYSLIMQMGTQDGSYWPDEDFVPSLVEKHFNPMLKFLQLSIGLPEKTTAKTVGSSILKHVSRIPFYLGVALFLIVAGILSTSWLLGYDNVWGRFKTWASRVQRRLERKQYVGLRNQSPTRSGTALRSTAVGAGRGENEEELGLDDFVDEEDDDGAGFSYRT